MKTETSDGSFVNSQHLDCLRRSDVPDANGRVVRGCDDDILAGMVDDAVDLLCVALENGDNLRRDDNLSHVKNSLSSAFSNGIEYSAVETLNGVSQRKAQLYPIILPVRHPC